MPKASKHGRAEVLEPYRHDWTPNSTEPAAHPTRGSPRRPRSARSSPRSGRTPPACRSQRSCSVGAALVQYRSSWSHSPGQHGGFLGPCVASEKTAAAEGHVGELRYDPFAMLPFCGYNMGDHFGHWLQIGAHADARQTATHLLRQLVRQGHRRQLAMAGIRREQPRAEVDHRTPRRPRRRSAQRDRQPAHAGILRRERDGPRRPAPPTPAHHRPPPWVHEAALIKDHLRHLRRPPTRTAIRPNTTPS